jgi:hypothetical protein
MRFMFTGLALGLVCAQTAFGAAAIKPFDFSIHEEYISTRAMGMGNAFTAVVDDHSAIFYNPAMIAQRTDSQLRLFIRGGATPDSIKIINDVEKIGKLPTADQPQAYSDLLASKYGEHFNYRLPTIGAMWVNKHWGVALIPADLSLDASFNRQVGPEMDVNLYVDTTLAISYAHKLNWFGKRHHLSWGMTLKGIHRIFVGDSLSAADLALNNNVFDTSQADEGFTGDVDLGLYWAPPNARSGFFKYFAPSFAIVGRNLVDYGFTTNFHLIDKNSGQPPDLQRRLDVGSKFQLPKLWVFDPKLAFDVRNIGYDEWSFKKGYHIGAELYWKMFNWWKGYWSVGDNQGYLTAGFGARMAWFQLDIATYGEEIGTNSDPKESRRYMLELALDF